MNGEERRRAGRCKSIEFKASLRQFDQKYGARRQARVYSADIGLNGAATEKTTFLF